MAALEFTAIQATRLTGCSVSQIRYWDRVGLVTPSLGSGRSRRYTFPDLVALRMVRSLLDAGLPLRRIRRAVEQLRAVGEDDLAGLRLVADGSTVFACRDDGEVLDALGHGQLALFVSVDAVAADVEAEVRDYTAERDAFVESLRAVDE